MANGLQTYLNHSINQEQLSSCKPVSGSDNTENIEEGELFREEGEISDRDELKQTLPEQAIFVFWYKSYVCSKMVQFWYWHVQH